MENQIRIFVLDYYMSAPLPGLDVCYSEFRSAAVTKVPVLRCFGSNGLGKKICVHIHGVFPYLYIPYDGVEDANKMSYQLATSIDKALNTALNQTKANTQHVYKVSLVSGIPMYGYHFKKHQFFKIYLYSPMLIPKVCNLLLNQSILGKIWQPHETHLKFTLQFMIDYNLHGMSNMIVDNLKYRRGSKIDSSCDNWLPYNIEKVTTCGIEGDINALDILNRQEIISGKLSANPGIAALWEDEKQRRRNKNETSQLGQFIELRNMDTPPTKSHDIFKEALLRRLALFADEDNNSSSSLDNSVYPAESPDDRDIQNASIVDLHTPSSYEQSLDDTVVNLDQSLDITVSQSNLNVSLEDTDKEFLKLLQEMAKQNKELREEDSILSQTGAEDENQDNNDSVEDSLDMTLSLDEVIKNLPPNLEGESKSNVDQSDDEDMFNTTIIPQLDGQTDEFDYVTNDNGDFDKCNYSLSQNNVDDENLKENSSVLRSLPYLDVNFLPNPENNSVKNRSIVVKDIQVKLAKLSSMQLEPFKNELTKKSCPKTSKSVFTKDYKNRSKHIKKKTKKLPKKEMEMHSFLFQIKKENRKDKIRQISSIFRKKYRSIVTSMTKNIQPKFRMVPGQKWWLDNLLYLNCDGTFHDGSSDEEEFEIRCKTVKGRKRAHSVDQERNNHQNFQKLGLKKSRL